MLCILCIILVSSLKKFNDGSDIAVLMPASMQTSAIASSAVEVKTGRSIGRRWRVSASWALAVPEHNKDDKGIE
jgi:hypothetical protein